MIDTHIHIKLEQGPTHIYGTLSYIIGSSNKIAYANIITVTIIINLSLDFNHLVIDCMD